MIHTHAAYKRSTSEQKTYTLKVKGWEKIFQANGQEEKARVAILTSDKTDYKTKAIKRQQKDTP